MLRQQRISSSKVFHGRLIQGNRDSAVPVPSYTFPLGRGTTLSSVDSLSIRCWCQATLPEGPDHEQFLLSSLTVRRPLTSHASWTRLVLSELELEGGTRLRKKFHSQTSYLDTNGYTSILPLIDRQERPT